MDGQPADECDRVLIGVLHASRDRFCW
jgi:hypothetical protein